MDKNINYCPQDELDEELTIDLKKILYIPNYKIL